MICRKRSWTPEMRRLDVFSNILQCKSYFALDLLEKDITGSQSSKWYQSPLSQGTCERCERLLNFVNEFGRGAAVKPKVLEMTPIGRSEGEESLACNVLEGEEDLQDDNLQEFRRQDRREESKDVLRLQLKLGDKELYNPKVKCHESSKCGSKSGCKVGCRVGCKVARVVASLVARVATRLVTGLAARQQFWHDKPWRHEEP
ncbi:hypothetical protein Pint_26179 [Pistacia integerrima]|uniref:Uncharacterized protein n=1 Tax=Pistacia integerrima TaxID=434235 RepID=A0ACC0YB42_9ROSI|nr:hypothetical protein Pint_26179 [Pistacia integerrima]